MGHIKFQMEGYLRDFILKDTDIFDPVVSRVDENSKESGKGFSPNIKTKDRQSQVEITKGSDHSTVVLSYPIDTDADASNGRLYLEDQFVFDRSTETLQEVHRTFRMSGGSAGSDDWGTLYGRLKKLEEEEPLKKEDPKVQKFFKDVVLKTPEPADLPEPPKEESS